MKNKNIIILTASLVLSLSMAGSVTDMVQGKDKKSAVSWIQMEEDAGITVTKKDSIPVEVPSTPTEYVEGVG
ncbi:MAG TPA: hypothetical protein VLN47_07500, partial [Clostridiaceae bacterium]|nr:hypothetical protein [Clostridiaceae bacterium]